MTLTIEEIQAAVESLLLVVAEPLPESRVVEIIQAESPETSADLVRQALTELVALYANPGRRVGLRVEEVAGGFQLRSPPESAPFLRRLLSAKPQRLTKAALETLAVIAYRQPVTKPDIESIRGVDVGAVLKGLLEHELIRIIGKSEELGRPILYGTTRKFLELFGLRSLTALPTLREYHELDEQHQKEVDTLYETDRPRISDLAERQAFLVDRAHDPDLDALATAEAQAEHAEAAARRALDPSSAEAAPKDEPAANPSAAAAPEAPAPDAEVASTAPPDAPPSPAPDADGASRADTVPSADAVPSAEAASADAPATDPTAATDAAATDGAATDGAATDGAATDAAPAPAKPPRRSSRRKPREPESP